jgi:DNA-binding response OmpR family regulator
MDGKKVLIIEDESTTLKALFEELEEAGLKVSSATDGESGLKVARDQKPDIILLDILLPKMDGLSVLKTLRKDDQTRDIPVLMLTNFSATDKVSEAIEMGASGYMVKSAQSVSDVVDKVKKELSDQVY